MLYAYTCNNCGHTYNRTNTVHHRKKGGRCPICTSSDTEHKQLMMKQQGRIEMSTRKGDGE